MLIKGNDRKTALLRLLVYGSVAAIGLILSFHSSALAHKVYIYAWFDGDTIHTESYFGSKKVKEGLVQVFDLSGKKLLEGRTNEKGEFAFKPPQKTDLRIVVEAGMGHKNECILKAEEVESSPDFEIGTVRSDEAKSEALSRKGTDAEQIRSVVEQVLDARLKPIQRELARIRKDDRPGFTEIMGGIGYILGLMGLIMYFKSRKK
jgi:nickel transport protein